MRGNLLLYSALTALALSLFSTPPLAGRGG
jgi:hypothetical protein